MPTRVPSSRRQPAATPHSPNVLPCVGECSSQRRPMICGTDRTTVAILTPERMVSNSKGAREKPQFASVYQPPRSRLLASRPCSRSSDEAVSRDGVWDFSRSTNPPSFTATTFTAIIAEHRLPASTSTAGRGVGPAPARSTSTRRRNRCPVRPVTRGGRRPTRTHETTGKQPATPEGMAGSMHNVMRPVEISRGVGGRRDRRDRAAPPHRVRARECPR